jgi:tRNA-Thr(GGU) m(6)t(6)A37 methyltransferase TsaA
LEQLTATPIGFARTGLQTKFDAPHQPDQRLNRCEIELIGGNNFEQALRDLEGFERIWLVWWFHKNSTWNPVVLPPRGQGIKRGVFATRSPHRPNPIGITAVQLFKIKKRTLIVGPLDLVDGTPILDIKPYIPEIDSFPESRSGWVQGLTTTLIPKFAVHITPEAQKQLDWLAEHGVSVFSRALELLSVDPSPNRTRRISTCGSGYKMGCGAWRILFDADMNNSTVVIYKIAPGYPERTLADLSKTAIPDRETQRLFYSTFKQ